MSLDVHLHSRRIGGLFQSGEHDYSFAYTPATVARGKLGEGLLSNSLPLRKEPFSPAASRAYVEGLLPQGRRRRVIAAELGLDPADGFGLIAELGADCPGAVTFGAQGERPPIAPAEPAWLDEEELAEAVQPQPGRLFGREHERRARFTLPGARHKLALVYDPESDRWAWPGPGAPSTHVVKPEEPGRPDLVANEMACTLAYREAGLPVAHATVALIMGQMCLVSKRFDRWGDGPRAERLHQESFAQALGVVPGARHRRGETPSLHEAHGLLRAIDEEDATRTLAKAVFADIGLGVCAPRAANAALLFTDDGPILAPFFGTVADEIYGAERRRRPVVGAPPAPLLVDIYRTAVECGLEFQPALIEAIPTMMAACTALNGALDQAREEGWHSALVEEALQLTFKRSISFKDEIEYLRPPGAEPCG